MHSITGVNECGNACPPTGLPSSTVLHNNCTLTLTATSSGKWYAISVQVSHLRSIVSYTLIYEYKRSLLSSFLQVEDFLNSSSTTPMSSVPIQFLVYVLPTPSCTLLPVIQPLSECLEVEVGVQRNFTVYILNLCNPTTSIVTDVVDNPGISGMQISNLVNSTLNTSLSFVTLDWTPQTNQIGSQQLCLIAYTK